MEKEEECIVYTQTIVPNTMRSSYWKYFGFPGNDNNEILTKNRVVCTLCNKVISYNKNTSNLRTHLVAKHQEKLFELNNFKNESSAPSTPSLKKDKIRKPSIKGDYTDSEEMSFEVLEENAYNFIPEHETSHTYSVISSGNHDQIEIKEKVPLKKQTYEIINEAPYDEYATEEIEKVSVETMTEHFGPEITGNYFNF